MAEFAMLDRALALAADRLDGSIVDPMVEKRRQLLEECPTPAHLAARFDQSYVRTEAGDLIAQRIVDAMTTYDGRLTVSQPPQTGKSLTLRWTCVWLLLRDPDTRIVYASYAASLARTGGRVIRSLIETYCKPYGLRLDRSHADAADWQIEGHLGGVYAVGTGGSLTGRACSAMIIDDPHRSQADADSQTMRENVTEWWSAVARTRLAPGAPVVGVATRWHEQDLISQFIGEGWPCVNIPAQADGETPDALDRERGTYLVTPRGTSEADWQRTRKEAGERTWCTPAETPILMADWTTRPIAQIKPGDRVMGYRHGEKQVGRQLALVPTTVEATSVRDAPVQTMRMESGSIVRCTAEHRWYTGRNPDVQEVDRRYPKHVIRTRPMYAPAKVGSKLYRFDPLLPPLTAERQRLLDYLAGIADGEGCWQDSALNIAQSPDSNPEVFAKIGQVLDALGYPYKLGIRERQQEHWGRHGAYVVGDMRLVAVEMLRRTDMAKRERPLSKLLARPNYPTRFRDSVLEITPGPVEPVYALQTGTGNYVAWGYASSNSALYQGNPTPLEGGVFKRAWFDTWRIEPDQVPDGCTRAVVVDPADNEGDGDEAGILLVASHPQGKVYVLDDLSAAMTVARWARVACLVCARHDAPTLAYEQSLSQLPARIRDAWKALHQQAEALAEAQGDADRALDLLARPLDGPEARDLIAAALAELTTDDGAAILAVGSTGPRLRKITAKGTKQDRMIWAAPKVETGRVVLAGRFPKLEFQALTWQVGQDSPDRVDALVHAAALDTIPKTRVRFLG